MCFDIFQLVTSYHPPKSQYASALKVCNHMKNKSPDHLATDSSRVYLNPTSDAEGSDYINASWLMGEMDLFRSSAVFSISAGGRKAVIIWRWSKEGRLDAKLSNEIGSKKDREKNTSSESEGRRKRKR